MNQTAKASETSEKRPSWPKRAWSALLGGIGWLLSPLSWWNDLLVNVPLAYLFALPFSLFDERLYVPAFVMGYWLTNVVGFILLHKGVIGAFSSRQTSLKKDLIIATMYTVVIAAAAMLGWLPSPASLLSKWQGWL